MGLLSMCPACGSDWCTSCECVYEKYAKYIVDLKKCITQVMTDEQLDCHPAHLNGESIREFLGPSK